MSKNLSPSQLDAMYNIEQSILDDGNCSVQGKLIQYNHNERCWTVKEKGCKTYVYRSLRALVVDWFR